jgi:DNA-binding response OmpR family regulator
VSVVGAPLSAAAPAPPGHADLAAGEAVGVLVVSDSGVLRNEMAALLDAQGYAVRIDDRRESELDVGDPFAIAVVDLAITTRSPVAVLAELRTRTSVPILAVSPEMYPESAVLEAFAAGADQFATRSRPGELVARVRALLRRNPPRPASVPPDDLELPIRLDRATGVAVVAGTEVRLTSRECDILGALMERPGRVVTRGNLAGPDRPRHGDDALDAAVRSVRTKLELAEGRRRIVAVRGVGFRLLPDRELHG